MERDKILENMTPEQIDKYTYFNSRYENRIAIEKQIDLLNSRIKTIRNIIIIDIMILISALIHHFL